MVRFTRWVSNKHLNEVKENTCASKIKHRDFIHVSRASLHNLNKFSVKIPMGTLTCVAGVSGSGKSTLVNHIIYEGLSNNSESFTGKVSADKKFDEVILVDQSTVSKTPRSNPILYTDAWNPIKEALGRTEESKLLGYLPGDFSFNSGNGRCEECNGLGFEVVEVQFLSDLQIPCSYCSGMRFKDDILKIKYKDLSVSEILNLGVTEALYYFSDLPKLTETETPTRCRTRILIAWTATKYSFRWRITKTETGKVYGFSF